MGRDARSRAARLNMDRHAPDAAAIEALAQRAIDRIPDALRAHLDGIVFRVEEFADEEALAALGIEDAWELSGLYEGRPLTERSIWESGDLPPRIRLFRRPLLEEWVDTGVALDDLIAHVIIHEIGHHFGFSDEDIDAINRGRD
ncbi:metallopeptidase family protein [Sphingobium sufflavum]|uniref:metallopeptidase family protein n=1 Tax=Sphingobium sufflavum TaxID=1129547 RepID=UPI001F2C11FD|nr:metallopeptidase family protein [Sphingobium sufflavum]MCE7797690.1 metallopeptidase family protein [Sphingobium sufflavum]